jgi:uridine kinase
VSDDGGMDQQHAVQAIVDAARRSTGDGVRLIGIDGPSGAGKSTIAQPVAAALGAPIVEIDDFVSWVDFAGWWPRFDEQVVTPLLAGRDARYQVRDWANDEFGDALAGWKTVARHPFVVLEGVTCTRRDVADRLAVRVWVDAPAKERLRRGIARDGESHRALWERWMTEESAFFAEDSTRERADVIVDATAGRDRPES